MKNYKFSIVIPIRQENSFLEETRHQLELQTYKNFELLVITDKISQTSNPSIKRNLGAKMSTGDYLCFLDDDSYPDKNWLKNINQQINLHPDYAAFCGPALTPPSDNNCQKASGLVWQSYLGSGGAGTYRNSPQKPRFVDDYPTVNLIIKKTDFESIHGFQSKYWPGEDTILCLDLTQKLNKKIYYHPSIIVFHHRRNVIVPHLQQIRRYALHRGLFAKKYPQTSLRIGYLSPSFFVIYLFTIPFVHLFLPLYLYFLLLFISFVIFLIQKNNLFISLLATITIPVTHIFYGTLFIIGFFSPDIDFHPHKINHQTGKYIGG